MFQNLHRMLHSGRMLQIACGACGHAAAWPSEEALRKLGPDATPMEVRRRLICGRCGAVDQVRVRI